MTSKTVLEFVDHDLLNTRLIDVQTGHVQFRITTRASYGKGNEDGLVIVSSRHTAIFNSEGLVAEIEWTGEEKKSGGLVRILDEQAISFTHLFSGHTTTLDSKDQLLIPTRLGYEWVATRESLRVRSVADRTVALEFSEQSGPHKNPGASGGYGDLIRLEDVQKRDVVELLVGFIFVNLMRRARFNLPKYQFPLVDTHHETRQSVPNVISHLKETFSSLRLLRRSTA